MSSRSRLYWEELIAGIEGLDLNPQDIDQAACEWDSIFAPTLRVRSRNDDDRDFSVKMQAAWSETSQLAKPETCRCGKAIEQ
ncbi:MAG: hypothetical protein AAGI17_08485 [Planctomycetota bacterium]